MCIRDRHAATHVRSVPVHQSHKGQSVWNGAVQIYELNGCPSGATRAYAWSYGLPGGQRRMFAVLHEGPITGPREAVKTAKVADTKLTRWDGLPLQSHLLSRYF